MPTPLEELTSISLILSATNHRNKNQHRLAKWWKAFGVLRRNIHRVSSELSILTANEERLGEKKKTLASREVVEKRAEFLEQWVVPKCYLAFSALVADNQYATLGLMLMGSLARIRRVIQPLRKELEDVEQYGEVKIDGIIGGDEILDFGEVIMRDVAQLNNDFTEGGKNEEGEDVDTGPSSKKKRKKRRSPAVEESSAGAPIESTPSKPLEKKRKKKRKDHDEFDDLFGSLL